jgi:hypothetical protein
VKARNSGYGATEDGSIRNLREKLNYAAKVLIAISAILTGTMFGDDLARGYQLLFLLSYK